jgi:hypothetical protein
VHRVAKTTGNSGPLAVILATPPEATTGRATLRRVEMAASHLGYKSFRVGNLLTVPTIDVNDIAIRGRDETVWMSSRPNLQCAIESASLVLLAFGCSLPSGAARLHMRNQLDWLFECMNGAQISDVVTFGGRTRHPSRWQRFTTLIAPGEPFDQVARVAYKIESLAVNLDQWHRFLSRTD